MLLHFIYAKWIVYLVDYVRLIIIEIIVNKNSFVKNDKIHFTRSEMIFLFFCLYI
jgi:hypothetical protein